MVRVVQATSQEDGSVIATYMAFAAHATAGGGNGLHGDWPQFLSDEMSARYGGVGIAMQGAIGAPSPAGRRARSPIRRTRATEASRRKQAIVTNYIAHVESALAAAESVSGAGRGGQALHPRADHRPRRDRAVRRPAATPVRGSCARARTRGSWQHRPHRGLGAAGRRRAVRRHAGEGFPSIGDGVRDAIEGEREVIQLGLANDQLGYLIAPVQYVPIIAAEAPVNDNIIFNVSPTIGDHVMCADIALALELGFEGASPAGCAPYDAADSAGDPVAGVPVGGVKDPAVE